MQITLVARLNTYWYETLESNGLAEYSDIPHHEPAPIVHKALADFPRQWIHDIQPYQARGSRPAKMYQYYMSRGKESYDP